MRSKMGWLWCEVFHTSAPMKRLLPTIAPFCMGIAYPDPAVAIAPILTIVPDTGEIPTARLRGERQGALPASVPDSPVSPLDLNGKRLLNAQTPSVPPPVPPENIEPNPNRDRFLQPAPEPEPVEEDTELEEPQPPPPPDTEPPADSQTTIQVEAINVTGSTVFGPEQLDPIVEPFAGRALTLEQLQEVADAITQLYLEKGYITSRAILVDQVIPPEGGDVEIRVLEGSLEEIRIEGTRRVNPEYVRSRVRLGADVPLNTAELEDQLRLLRVDPLFENVEASLRAGTQAGKSILIVRVTEANPFEGSFGVDNYSPPSVGSERLGLNLRYLNITGWGDAFDATWYHTAQGGSDQFEFVYRLPVNPKNGTLQLRTSFNQNDIISEDLRALNIEGDSELYEISFRQPFIRTPREEFALSLGLTFQENQSLIDGFGFPSPGADDEGITRTSVIKFGQDYLRRDPRGAWSFRSLFSFGTDWFDATENSPPEPDGRFFSWLGQVQRVQVLNENNFLIVGADLQLTPNTLLTSQQFVVGGGQSLRGYRQNVRARDNGIRLFIEDRITLERDEAGAATFQLAPFFDAAYVWNDPDNPSNDFLDDTQPEQFLAGIGMGIIWEPLPNLNLRFDFAIPLIDIEDRGENAQDDGIHFSVRYRF